MLHEIATAEAAIRSHEDRVLERMEEAETITARGQGGRGGAQDAAGRQSRPNARPSRPKRRRCRARPTKNPRRAETAAKRAVPAGAEAVRARVEAAQGHRGRRGARRQLHPLPRAHAAAGVQRCAAQREPDPVRELPADPLLRAAERSDPSTTRARHSPESLTSAELNRSRSPLQPRHGRGRGSARVQSTSGRGLQPRRLRIRLRCLALFMPGVRQLDSLGGSALVQPPRFQQVPDQPAEIRLQGHDRRRRAAVDEGQQSESLWFPPGHAERDALSGGLASRRR